VSRHYILTGFVAVLLGLIALGSLRAWHTTERVLDDGAFESCQRLLFSEA
jgi:hypothetical protein